MFWISVLSIIGATAYVCAAIYLLAFFAGIGWRQGRGVSTKIAIFTNRDEFSLYTKSMMESDDDEKN